MDDGVIKFQIKWEEGAPIDHPVLMDLMYWRDRMYELKLIGFDKRYQVGYGNISIRIPGSNEFLISGTQTGHIRNLKAVHYTRVVSYDIDRNGLTCVGPVKASSESLTHAAIYEADQSIQAIIHIHHDEQWKNLLNKVPTTNETVPYGTPEMAYEIKRLFSDEAVSQGDIIAMAGHQGGLITFGNTLKEAAQPYLSVFNRGNQDAL